MSVDDLAARNAADHLHVLEAAIADERRGLTIRRAQGGRVDAIERNIARLEAELSAARTHTTTESKGSNA